VTPTALSAVGVTSTADDDGLLVDALVARDPRAAAVAWTRLSPLVLSVLRRYFGNGHDRQDLCQEVFLRFFARISELRSRHAVRGFLIGICLGVAQNELRRTKARRWILVMPPDKLPELPVPAGDVEARDATRRFYLIIASASASDRALFVTRFVEKMEVAEIAAATGRPLSTTKRHLARAARRITAKMRHDPILTEYVDGLLGPRTAAPRTRRRRTTSQRAAARSAEIAAA
jgi:RNA polymerase sigma-70 factor (ECF subfamily)